jgi:hypothetical protein
MNNAVSAAQKLLALLSLKGNGLSAGKEQSALSIQPCLGQCREKLEVQNWPAGKDEATVNVAALSAEC